MFGGRWLGRRFADGDVGPKIHRRGTHRTATPEHTWLRARALMNAAGITRVANVTGLDCIGIPVVMVCRPNSRSLSVSQGKGLTLMDAKASGIMEALELHHAETVDGPLRVSSFQNLSRWARVVNAPDLPRPAHSAYHPDLALPWVEGHDLLADEPAWVPYEVVHTDFRASSATVPRFFMRTSNGLASGNHLLEAVSHALCEVIERDAITVWNALAVAAKHRTKLKLETVDDADCREVLDRFADAAVDVAVWDTTSDVGIACFRCMAVNRGDGDRLLATAEGQGCHPSREVALLRALTEAAQGRLTHIVGSRDDLGRTHYDRLSPASLVPAQVLARLRGERDFATVPNRDFCSIAEDVAWQLERLVAAGVGEVIVVELTKPELALPVVRVVVPGLETLDDAPGYVPGPRLRRRWLT